MKLESTVSMQAELHCRNILNEIISVKDCKQVLQKGYLMSMKKKCQHFKSTSTVVWDTDNDKISSDRSIAVIESMVLYILLIFHTFAVLWALCLLV
jgi:hypothetical protein